MNSKALITMALVTTLVMFGCAKQSGEKTNTDSTAPAETSSTTSADQQAKIDALDKPVLDEKNTDISAASAAAPSH